MPASSSIWTNERPSPAPTFGTSIPDRADVVVVGAGIAGLSTAAMLADHGIDVAVMEAGDGSQSVSMRSSAKVSVLHELTAAKIARARGRRIARQYIEANRFGADWIRRYVDERDVACSWEARDAVVYTNDPSSFPLLDSEAELYRSAGIDAVANRGVSDIFGHRRRITVPGQAQFDPAAFLDRVGADLVDAGHTVLHGTRVTGVTRRGDSVRVTTSAGTIEAAYVVVTTGLPFLDRGLFFARAEPQSSYVVAVKVESPPPPGMYLIADDVKRSVRTATTKDGDDVLLVGGEGHKTGQGGDTEQRYRNLVAWANSKFGVREVTHRFAAQDYMTGDHVPFAGPVLPGNDRILIATGMNKWGFTNAPAAAVVNISGIVGGEAPSWTHAFSSSRIPLAGVGDIVAANANVAAHMIGGWAAALTKSKQPDPGEGHVRFRGVRPVAESARCDNADVIGVDGKCPHLGASLVWNPAEETWDCPLHGSRFEASGRLLHGPATSDLARRSPR